MHTASLTKWPSETGGVDRGDSCSPSPSPLSPSFRRKRLRKGSTGSTSGGSADKTEEINEITLVATNIVKPEPHIVPQEGSEHLRRPINVTTDTQGSIDEDQISIVSSSPFFPSLFNFQTMKMKRAISSLESSPSFWLVKQKNATAIRKFNIIGFLRIPYYSKILSIIEKIFVS